jgi:hypothetical protein
MRIPGLAKLISSLLVVCAVIGKFGPKIRTFVPDESKSAYDTALTAITGACDVLRAIDYVDSLAGTNPLWGAR